MPEILFQNLSWFLLLVLITVFVLAATVFFDEVKILFSNRQLVFSILSIPLIEFFLKIFSNNALDENESSVFLLLIIVSLLTSLIFGLITKLILQILNNEETNLTRAFSSIRTWIIPSIVSFCIGFGGQLLIFHFLPEFDRSSKIFLSLIWGISTFALYPLLIADEGNILYSLLQTFKFTFLSIHKWFYLYLIIIFVSGEFLQLFPSSSVRISWTGGYSFQPLWLDFFVKNLKASPLTMTLVYIVSVLISSLTAVLVKIRLTKTLLGLGYISKKIS